MVTVTQCNVYVNNIKIKIVYRNTRFNKMYEFVLSGNNIFFALTLKIKNNNNNIYGDYLET